MRVVGLHPGQRHLVRAERAAAPARRRRRRGRSSPWACAARSPASPDAGPPRRCGRAPGSRAIRVVRVGERGVQVGEDQPRVVPGDHDRRPALAGQVAADLVVGGPAPHRRPADLVAVEVQHRQHRAVAAGVEERRHLPRPGQRPGLGLAVPDDAGHQQVGVVEGGAGGVHQGVAELAALVDRPRGGHPDVAGDAAGGGELPEQRPDAGRVGSDGGVQLAVGALEPGGGDQRRPTVARSGDVQDRLPGASDQSVELHVQRREAGGGAPVAQQPGLDVGVGERALEQDVLGQVDLADGQVVGRGPPPQVQLELARPGRRPRSPGGPQRPARGRRAGGRRAGGRRASPCRA